jgi:glyoxylase-like metal-dependent hydrolase (beta-lactamase superfamily II)
MGNPTRRHLLAGIALAPVAMAGLTVAPGRALAAAPPVGTQAPGFYRFKVGDIEVTTVNDGFARRPGIDQGFVTNATPEEVRALLTEQFMPTSHLDIPFTTTFVNTGAKLIAFDSGTGGQLAPTAGVLWTNMKAAGIDPAKVDMVVISHFHGDHILGLRTKDGTAVYPNAEVAVPEAEWKYWMDDGALARAPMAAQGGFRNARNVFTPFGKKVRRYGDNTEFAAGVRSVAAVGHTPGHTVFHVSSGKDQLMVLSDTTNHPAINARRPDWRIIFDMDGAKAAETRRRLFERWRTVSGSRAIISRSPRPAMSPSAARAISSFPRSGRRPSEARPRAGGRQ